MNDAVLPAMPAPSDSRWSRLRTTPLGDVWRGKLTGSLDVRRLIASANLPDPLPGLLYVTIRRARLWRSERLKVSGELINRFQADLTAGRSIADIVSSFGDPTRAARLIRRERIIRPTIAGVDLPQSLQELVCAVARRTRLWRRERIDVARELAGHFRDGIDAGQTAEHLLKSFGDPRKAARLIRRAKLRNRPLGWRALRRAGQALGVFIAMASLFYIVLSIRFFTAHPTISRNYGLEMNAAARAIPERDRAWPLYREALMRLTAEPRLDWPPEEKPPADAINFSVETEKPGGKHWNLVAEWLQQNQAAVDLMRQARNRPRLGFVYGDPADRPWLLKIKTDPKYLDINENRFLFALMLPHLNEARNLLNLLLADAHRAAGENDRAAFMHDVEATVAFAKLIRDDMPLVITDIISFNFFGRALTAIDETLAESPDFLTDANLKELAHCIAGYSYGGTIRCRLSGERLMLRDLFQRMYSDDGRGDGRLTIEGLQMLANFQAFRGDDKATWVAAPLVSLFIADRNEMATLSERLFDGLESEISRPPWQRSNSAVHDELDRLTRSRLDAIRYGPVIWEFRTLLLSVCAGDRVTQRRDATSTAIALVLFHRRTGVWPKDLTALVPDLLPAIPPDRMTGGPLHYRIVNGRPLLYSAGPDKRDDGGRAIAEEDAETALFSLAPLSENKALDGDWILWPPAHTDE